MSWSSSKRGITWKWTYQDHCRVRYNAAWDSIMQRLRVDLNRVFLRHIYGHAEHAEHAHAALAWKTI
jgi:hypothetical protein